jgi:hypothetical protein
MSHLCDKQPSLIWIFDVLVLTFNKERLYAQMK